MTAGASGTDDVPTLTLGADTDGAETDGACTCGTDTEGAETEGGVTGTEGTCTDGTLTGTLGAALRTVSTVPETETARPTAGSASAAKTRDRTKRMRPSRSMTPN